ncbi:2OG-Fe dioxygenase family protein [Massilia sp. YIM B02443]|uniref:2OG-Fe dioxygenase family protein n=1 Tax=Massilia sp. YIM B02443 TaxID=3050127 RepID=UPI0025B72DC3|nr:2OG-Fe dioxygenase family protein [Massilia sp. YIM B02443]MDN4035548.1 2OG-Fe dioxygenase family protein [Massilia sp. YIM B02443]
MTTSQPPSHLPYTAPSQLTAALRDSGYALLRPSDVAALAGCGIAELDTLAPSWNRLELDNYLKDGGRYRRRRHSCFIDDGATLSQTPHRAHWQPVEYNALHGGMHRLFAPVEGDTVANPCWERLLRALGGVCSEVRGQRKWYVEAHQFRIDTADGIGRPTPEGAHRDGVDFVAVILVKRESIKGGETRVFDADGPNGQRFTMLEPWTMLLLDDAAVIHESTPIQPLGEHGHRDTLVLTWRADGFQGENA